VPGLYEALPLYAATEYLGVPQRHVRLDDLTLCEYNRRVQSGLLVMFQQELTREILAAHAAGYSTSTHDLIDDLLPF
jgi:hypothetical protein